MVCLDKSGQPVPTAQGEKQNPKHKAARSPQALILFTEGNLYVEKRVRASLRERRCGGSSLLC